MNRFFLRELILVCAPLLVLASAGILLSLRKPPPPAPLPPPLHLKFHVDKPTTLEAFGGANAALVVELAGDKADQTYIEQSSVVLDLETLAGHTKSRSNHLIFGNFWYKVWKTNGGTTRFLVDTRPIPKGTLRFSCTSKVDFLSSPRIIPNVSGDWLVERTKIRPPNLSSIPREPELTLKEVRIKKASAGQITGECVLNLKGKNMDARTPVEASYSGGIVGGRTTQGLTWYTNPKPVGSPANPLQRVMEWSTFAPARKNQKLTGKIGGRFSANNHWPLAFECLPFDAAHLKSGRSLKFKSWPLAAPISK